MQLFDSLNLVSSVCVREGVAGVGGAQVCVCGGGGCVHMCVCACVCVCVHECVRAYVRACIYSMSCVFEELTFMLSFCFVNTPQAGTMSSIFVLPVYIAVIIIISH